MEARPKESRRASKDLDGESEDPGYGRAPMPARVVAAVLGSTAARAVTAQKEDPILKLTARIAPAAVAVAAVTVLGAGPALAIPKFADGATPAAASATKLGHNCGNDHGSGDTVLD